MQVLQMTLMKLMKYVKLLVQSVLLMNILVIWKQARDFGPVRRREEDGDIKGIPFPEKDNQLKT